MFLDVPMLKSSSYEHKFGVVNTAAIISDPQP